MIRESDSKMLRELLAQCHDALTVPHSDNQPNSELLKRIEKVLFETAEEIAY